MKVGVDYHVYPQRNTWPVAAKELGVDADELVARVLELASTAPDAFASAAGEPDITELNRPLANRMVDLVADRAARCARTLDSPNSLS
jgi:serine/threonine-protein kinase HipA